MQVKPENGPDFENVWKNRDSKLLETPGFIRFALLKGDEEGIANCLLTFTPLETLSIRVLRAAVTGMLALGRGHPPICASH